jgi:hypothetical protein
LVSGSLPALDEPGRKLAENNRVYDDFVGPLQAGLMAR